MPVGRCVIRTAESVVFTLCPPGPEERNTSTLMSASGISIESVCSISGTTSTAAKDVCRRPWLSNGEIRTSRWVPASTDRTPNAYGALISKVADFRPASSAYEVSSTAVPYPFRSAQRRYIRISISAKSAASTPPAPARMVTTASRWSYSPESRVRISRSESALRIEVSSAAASSSVSASSSSCASSTNAPRSSMRPASFSSRSRSCWAWESLLVTC